MFNIANIFFTSLNSPYFIKTFVSIEFLAITLIVQRCEIKKKKKREKEGIIRVTI